MTYWHIAFDLTVQIVAVLYARSVVLREVERWRQRKHADIEIERISAKAMAEIAEATARESRLKWQPCAVITEYKPAEAVPPAVLDQINQYRCPICGTVGGRYVHAD